jgi:hypothetical protein
LLLGHRGQIGGGPEAALDPEVGRGAVEQFQERRPASGITDPGFAGGFAPGERSHALTLKAVDRVPDGAVGEAKRRHDLRDALPLGREQDRAGVAIGDGIGRTGKGLGLGLFFRSERPNK